MDVTITNKVLMAEPIAGYKRVLVITYNPDGSDGATQGILEWVSPMAESSPLHATGESQ